MARITSDTPPYAVELIDAVADQIKQLRSQFGTRDDFADRAEKVLGPRPDGRAAFPMGRLASYEDKWRDPSLIRLAEIAHVLDADVEVRLVPRSRARRRKAG